jgi:signal transduction histidine kinase
MPTQKPRPNHRREKFSGSRGIRAFHDISRQILRLASRRVPLPEFLREVSRNFVVLSGCDVVALQLKDKDKCYRCELTRGKNLKFDFSFTPCMPDVSFHDSGRPGETKLEHLRGMMLCGRRDTGRSFFTRNGSFWSGNREGRSKPAPKQPRGLHPWSSFATGCRSLVVIPLLTDQNVIGLMEFRSARQNFFSLPEVEFYEGIAGILAMALGHQHAQIELRERVKELTCLYGIARLMDHPHSSSEEILSGIAALLPSAWLYPETSSSRIILDGRAYTSPGFEEKHLRQSADIVVNGEIRGTVEMTYSEPQPEVHKGGFLKEERSLIDTVAHEVALFVERFKAEEETRTLQDQLRHADRLATIGLLSAGIAHELNEPLGSILGFAQLAVKAPELPSQVAQDIHKIVTATLHAREVIKKLMLFSRQMPPRTGKVDLNHVIEDGLIFLESRCSKAGIELVRDFAADLPKVTADPSQLTQVLVNLVVNAVQAMPEGGCLTIRTQSGNGHVSWSVTDTGIGMNEEVLKQIFLPFFTTKDVGEGTGLGLPVVHGIVTAHGGTMKVESQVGQGSRIEIQLPVSTGKERDSSQKHDDPQQ